MIRSALRLGCAALTLFSFSVVADSEKKISEKDFARYLKVREAEALATAKRDLLPNAKVAERAAADAQFTEALKAQGMDQDGWYALRGELDNAVMALEEGRSAEDLEAEFSKETLAVARAHKAEILDRSHEEKARALAKEEAAAAKRGRAPTHQELQGTWVADYGATVDAMGMGFKGADREKMIEGMKQAGEVSYAFKGDTMEARSKAPGKPVDVQTATYRLEGNTLFYKSGKRERDLVVGMQGKQLHIQLFGVGMVFTKK